MNTKKSIAIILLIAVVSYLSFGSYKKIQQNKRVQENIQLLPDFTFQQQPQGNLFYSRQIAPGKKLIINYFNPDCEHCQLMAVEMKKSIARLTAYQLIFITTADSLAIADFKRTYQLGDYPNFIFLRDSHAGFAKLFGTHMIPSFFVYDEHKVLVKKIDGETKIENLLQ